MCVLLCATNSTSLSTASKLIRDLIVKDSLNAQLMLVKMCVSMLDSRYVPRDTLSTQTSGAFFFHLIFFFNCLDFCNVQ